jgi:23S rRNA A2030 N6-methylase RlmJ
MTMTFEELLEEYFCPPAATGDPELLSHGGRAVHPLAQRTARRSHAYGAGMARLSAERRDIKPVSWNHYMRHLRALYNFAIRQVC